MTTMTGTIHVEDIKPSTSIAFKIGSRWYWVTEIHDVLASGSRFFMTVPVAKDPRYARLNMGKLRYVQASEHVQARSQDAPRWDWVTKRLAETAKDPALFARTAPQWNCVTYLDGPHYTPGRTCQWCGKTRIQIDREYQDQEAGR